MKTITPLFRIDRLLPAALFVIAIVGASHEAKAQYQITTLGTAVVENFNGMLVPSATSGVNNINFNGALGDTNQTQRNAAWSLTSAAGRGNDTGSNTSGGWRAYADANGTDKALGALGNASLTALNATATYVNASGSTVTSFVFSYTGEQWRGNTGPGSITVQYSINGGTFTALSTSTFTATNTTNGAMNGDAAGNRTTGLGATVTGITLNATQNIQFRFLYTIGSSSKGVAADDISVTFNGGAPPAGADLYWTADGSALGGAGTWDTTGNNWTANASPVSGTTWDSNKKAIFTNSAATVTVSTVTASAGIQFATDGYTLSSGTLTLGGSAIASNTITTDSAVSATINSVLAGSAGLTKAGAGTLTLGGANTVNGGISLNAGGLSVAADSNLGNAASAITFGGGTLVTTAGFTTARGFSGSGSLDVASGTTLTNSGTVNMTALTIVDTGTFEMSGATRTLGDLAFTAGGTINASGAVTVSTLSAASLTGTATFNPTLNFSSAGDKTVTVGSSGNLVIGGEVQGIGPNNRIFKQELGTLTVSGTVNTNGGYRIGTAGSANGGTIIFNSGASAGVGAMQLNFGRVEAGAGGASFTNIVSIGGRGASNMVFGGANALTFSGPVGWFADAGQASTMQVDNTTTFTGVVSNSAGTSIDVSGSGMLVLSGTSANTFDDAFNIASGLTVIAGKNGALGTTTGSTVVASGGSLVISNVTYSTAEAVNITGSGVGGGGALRGASTASFAGAVTLGGNATIAADSGAALTLSGNIAGGGNTLTLAGAGNSALSGIVSNGGLVKAGGGTATLSGANTYSGGTLISAGTLLGSTRSLQGTITNNSALVFSQSTNGTFASVISGSGGTVTKTGSGTVTFTQNNTYNGATTVSAGGLIVNGSQGGSAVTVDSGASLGGTGTVGGLTVSGLLAPGNSIGTLSAGNTTLNGGGSFELEVFDWVNTPGVGWDRLTITGDLTLSSISSTPGNQFTINLVSFANSTTPGLSTDWDQNVNFTNTFITYSGSLLGTSFASDLFTVNTGSFSNTINGTFSITNVSGGLALLYTTSFVPTAFYEWVGGSGNWSVGANWTNNAAPTNGVELIFSGGAGTATNNATVASVLGVSFTNTSGSIVLAGDAFAIGAGGIANDSANAHTISNNVSFSSAATISAAAGNLTIAGNVTNDVAAQVLTVGGAFNTTISGAISGAGGLTKTGAGSLTLDGANSYTGGTTISAGTVVGTTASLQGNIANGSFLEFSQAGDGTYSGAISGAGLVTKSGAGNVTFSGANTYNGGTIISGGTLTGSTASVPGDVDVSSGATFALDQTTNGTFSGLIEGTGRFVKAGSGNVTLEGANTYSGGTLVSGGTLTGTASSLQGPITNNAAVVFNQASAGTYSGAMSGNGSLVKSGAGSLTLSGPNSYGGGTLVSAGTLVGSTTSLQGPITNNAAMVMSQTTNGTFAGSMTGAGGFTKAGSGIVTLGDNSGFTGAVGLQAGGLVAADANAFGSGAVTVTDGSIEAANGITITNSFTIGAASGTEIYYSENFNSIGSGLPTGWTVRTNASASSIGGSAAFTTAATNWGASSAGFYNFASATGLTSTSDAAAQNGSTNRALGTRPAGGAPFDPGAAFTYAFSTTGKTVSSISLDLMLLNPQGRTNVWTLEYGIGANPASFTSLGTWTTPDSWGTTATNFTSALFSTNLNDLGNLVFRVVNLSASTGSGSRDAIAIDNFVINTATGASGSGTLGINEAGSATFSGNIVNNNQATLTAASGGTATFSGGISGLGSVTKTGAGDVVLAGANTYSGGTTINEGVLYVGNGGTSGSITGPITNNSSLVFNRSDSSSYSGSISGSGTVTKSGAGSLTLSGASTYSGATTVSAGTLELNNTTGQALASTTSLSVTNGAVLLISQSNQVNNSASVSLSGGTITRGAGVSEVFGALTLNDDSFLDFGTGAIGTFSFTSYTPSALLTVNNFLPGNKLTFTSNLSSDIENSALFSFQGQFEWDWDTTTPNTFTITAIPEPSTYLAAAGLLSLMLWPSRKRLIKDAKKILGLRAPMRDRLAARRA